MSCGKVDFLGKFIGSRSSKKSGLKAEMNLGPMDFAWRGGSYELSATGLA